MNIEQQHAAWASIRIDGCVVKEFIQLPQKIQQEIQCLSKGPVLRPISSQENKHGVGSDWNKIEPVHGLSVPIFCSSLNL